MSWKHFVETIFETKTDPLTRAPAFRPPAEAEEIAQLETSLAVQLPIPLKDLLLETNGVMEMIWIQSEWIENLWLVWSAEEIAGANLSVRRIWSGKDPQVIFENLLFFANAGSDGILFAFDTLADDSQAQAIVSWHPIENRITRIGFSFENFLENWLTGHIDLR